MCQSCQFPTFGRCQDGCNEQDGICTDELRLEELVGTDDEVLAQDWQTGQLTGLADIAQVSSKELFVGKDGEGCRTSLLISCGERSIGVGMQSTFGGRAAFELGNDTGR